MTNIAPLGYEIDSSQARTAARDLDRMNAAAVAAAGGATKLSTASRNLLRDERGKFMSAAQSVEKYGSEIDRLRMKYNPLYAASQRFEQSQNEIRRALALGAITTGQAEAALENLQMQYIATGNAAATASAKMGGFQVSTGNVFAQLNDVGVMMASGQNPFILAIQQGSQLNQIWAGMGERGRTLSGVFGMLRGGLAQFMNPMGLLTIASIAGGAALVQWGMSALEAEESANEFEDRLSELQDTMSTIQDAQEILEMSTYDLGEEYGTAAGRVREFAIAQSELALGELTRQLGDQVNALIALTREYSNTNNAVSEFGDNQDFSAALRAIRDDFGATTEQAGSLLGLMDSLNNSDTFESQQTALRNILRYLRDQNISLAQIPPELNTALQSMINLSNETDRARELMDKLAKAARTASENIPGIVLDDAGNPTIFGEGSGARRPPRRAPREGEHPATGAPDRGAARDANRYARAMQSRLDSLLEELQTEREALKSWYDESEDALAWALANERITLAAHNEARLDLEREYQERLREIRDNPREKQLQDTADFFEELNDLAGGGYDGLLRAQRSFAAASALINTYTAASQALADPKLPFFAKFAAVAKVLASGFGLVNAIKGGSKSGASGGGGGTSTSGVTQTAPDRRVIIDVQGPDWMKSMIDPIIRQIQDATKDGSKVILA